MNEGFFLSPEALEEAKELFAERFRSTKKDAARIYKRDLSSIDWTSFDELYLALYEFNLYGRRSRKLKQKKRPDTFAHRMSLRLLIDKDFPNIEDGQKFEQTLIDEFLISDLMKLRGRIEEIISYPVELREFGVGCIFLEFNIFGKPNKTKKSLPSLDEDHIKSSRVWNSLKSRFEISELELNSI